MSELVYAIKNVFSTNAREGALGKNKSDKYYIAPYQRGYKWGSYHKNDAVCLLMSDLFDAINDEEYYLQYITVKTSDVNEVAVLEVIDGQQRLTTLTLIIAVLAHRLKDPIKDISKYKLLYLVRQNVSDFFENYIYGDISQILNDDLIWDDFAKENSEYDSQDIFYLISALRHIDSVLPEDVEPFYDFLMHKVKLIFNCIDKSGISSEKIFSNLNTNKVDLTSTELVKALILTKVGREHKEGIELRYKEVLEIRSTIGRQWDEMANWAGQSHIKSFYFNKATEPMSGLIELLALKHQYKKEEDNSKYALFNFFQSKLKVEEISAASLFLELRQLYFHLNDWYNNGKTRKLLGYLFFHKGSKYSLESLIELLDENKEKTNKILSDYCLKTIGEEELSYGKSDVSIHCRLLFINVFGVKASFNFEAFADEKWTLEHIFPQTPNIVPDSLLIKDIELINSLLLEDWKDKIQVLVEENNEIEDADSFISNLSDKLELEKCTVNEYEKNLLYKLIDTTYLNSIGNMALLTNPDNISNTNGMFDAKRVNIVNLISKGSFVPRHTYDVFSKLLSSKMSQELTCWTKNDIIEHKKWMDNRIKELKSELL